MNDLHKVVGILKKGGLVMHPTETCYGFAVDIFSEKALRKLYEVKKMDLEKPVSILCGDLEMAREYGIFNEKALQLASEYWPGALSILVPRTKKLPNFLNPGHQFVSIRVSGDEFSREIVEEFGRPVTTTSANVSGKPQLYEVDLGQFGEHEVEIDFVVDRGKILENKPSTILKVSGEELEVLRKGDLEIKID